MKKIVLALTICCIIFYACDNKTDKSKELNTSDNADITIPDSFFSTDGTVSRKDTTINSDTAKMIMKAYEVYMDSLGVDTSNNNLTRAVSFNSKNLKKWIKKYDIFNKSDELRIFFGRYPDLPVFGANRNRLTLILWPYKNGFPAKRGGVRSDKDDELDPFNLGNLKP
jgi:hypothetical protein